MKPAGLIRHLGLPLVLGIVVGFNLPQLEAWWAGIMLARGCVPPGSWPPALASVCLSSLWSAPSFVLAVLLGLIIGCLSSRPVVCGIVLSFGVVVPGIWMSAYSLDELLITRGGVIVLLMLPLWLMSRRREGMLDAHAARCAECGYELYGNVSGTCPECGTNVPGKRAGLGRVDDGSPGHQRGGHP